LVFHSGSKWGTGRDSVESGVSWDRFFRDVLTKEKGNWSQLIIELKMAARWKSVQFALEYTVQ
jgi:hypothetical protein